LGTLYCESKFERNNPEGPPPTITKGSFLARILVRVLWKKKILRRILLILVDAREAQYGDVPMNIIIIIM
jgi:hypothetical protein